MIALIRSVFETRTDRNGNRYSCQVITATHSGEAVTINYKNTPDACTYEAADAGGYQVHETYSTVGLREIREQEAQLEHLAQGSVWRLLTPEHGIPGLARKLASLVQMMERGVEAENDGTLSEHQRYARTHGARIAREDLAWLCQPFGVQVTYPGMYPLLNSGETLAPGTAERVAAWLYEQATA